MNVEGAIFYFYFINPARRELTGGGVVNDDIEFLCCFRIVI